MSELTLPDQVAVKTLIAHQRRDIGSCICGWGVDTGDLGRSHSLHVWRELQAAGVAPADWPADWAALTAERDRLHATVEWVRGMHRPDPNGNAFCQSCDRQFPCPTWRELGGAP